MPELWVSADRNDADGCLHLLPPVHGVRNDVAAEAGRLLCLLLLRLGSLPANTSGATVLWLGSAVAYLRLISKAHLGTRESPGILIPSHVARVARRTSWHKHTI
jgi:hypothetical protein